MPVLIVWYSTHTLPEISKRENKLEMEVDAQALRLVLLFQIMTDSVK